jgi:hypothetical protein
VSISAESTTSGDASDGGRARRRTEVSEQITKPRDGDLVRGPDGHHWLVVSGDDVVAAFAGESEAQRFLDELRKGGGEAASGASDAERESTAPGALGQV